jgi:hypothetical protein
MSPPILHMISLPENCINEEYRNTGVGSSPTPRTAVELVVKLNKNQLDAHLF